MQLELTLTWVRVYRSVQGLHVHVFPGRDPGILQTTLNQQPQVVSGRFGYYDILAEENIRSSSSLLTLPERRPVEGEQRDVVAVRTLYPDGKPIDVQAVTLLNRGGNFRILEIAIPLDQLGLDSATLVPIPGWVCISADLPSRREYHPRAGQAIGLAMDRGDMASSATYRVDDPTTWNTLIFIADR